MVRASRGLTQARVSAGAGISERTLSEWERGIFGRSGPGVWVLGRVAEFYGVELEDLIRGDVGRLVGEAG